MPPTLPGTIRRGSPRTLERLLAQPSPETHLNVGCGSRILDDWTNADLWTPRGHVPGGRFVEMDAGHTPWPFDDGRFRVIYADCVLPHLAPTHGRDPDPVDVFLRESHRTLAPGGHLVVTAPDPRDAARALGRVHHHRLVHPEMFRSYLRPPGGHGVKAAEGGPFASMDVVWGYWGTKAKHRRDPAGRPLGVSRVAPNLLPMGLSRLGLFTHLLRRLRLRGLLRGEKLLLILTK